MKKKLFENVDGNSFVLAKEETRSKDLREKELGMKMNYDFLAFKLKKGTTPTASEEDAYKQGYMEGYNAKKLGY